MRIPGKSSAGYGALLAAAFLVAVLAGYSAFGRQVDGDAYDFLFRLKPIERNAESVIVAIDEAALLPPAKGIRGLRSLLAQILEKLSQAPPKVVVVDLTLADAGDSADDDRLETALKKTANLVLASEMMPDGSGWQDPLARFRRWAAALGHVHAEPDPLDGVAREAALEKVAGRERRWALALEAYRLSRGVGQALEAPEDLTLGSLRIPARREEARPVFIRFLPPRPGGDPAIPRVSAMRILEDPHVAESLKGKVVFIGVTAQSAARDRLVTPFGPDRPMPGVEIHASLFETLAGGRFLRRAGNLEVILASLALVVMAGVAFQLLAGTSAYVAGGGILLAAHLLPYALYGQDIVFLFTAPVMAAWLSVAGAASYQHFAARRRLRRAEAEKARYQQAMHFVTHEMRTPLTAIQGSSELMSRYALGEEKRKQIASLIHSESKRLAKMVETFLNVERLSAGQMELKPTLVRVADLMEACISRAEPLAERKHIQLRHEPPGDLAVRGDQELLEYALYNLLTNAVKYSPTETEVCVSASRNGAWVRVAVRDQGIGMDEKELGSIFRKFYRTKRAVESGEGGIGIGLSIVNEIVLRHGGKVEVTSQPGKGSCFTLVLPAQSGAGEN